MADAMWKAQGNVIYSTPAQYGTAVGHGWRMLQRDHEAVFGMPARLAEKPEAADVVLRLAEARDGLVGREEAFCLQFVEDGSRTVLHIAGTDELGLVNGILHYSRAVLGVDPFWFWADLEPAKREGILVPCETYVSPVPKVRYRGWFVNDEVCLIGWKEPYPPTREVWEPVFEALLRCGGNMVIPGTDLPRSGIHWELASEMGLWITHHHAEPLGAEMFLRAYPGKQASYKEHPELFESLWRKAVLEQKDKKVVWVLSFRGQGDAPFWQNDPQFTTAESRGDLISRVVQIQYDMVRAEVEAPVCCMALYGEIAELYKQGHITVPEGVIQVWADNGYGRMVSRRTGNESFRVPSLPGSEDLGRHGIYYHVTFHDLQASNHLAMFPGGLDLIREEVEGAFAAGASDYVLVNSGNIRPHLVQLDLVGKLWLEGEADSAEVLESFVARLYGGCREEIAELYRDYERVALRYGPHRDDCAGDEFYHHPARRIIGHWLQGKRGKTLESLLWATGKVPFDEQVAWFVRLCESGLGAWRELKAKTEGVLTQLSPEDGRRLRDQFLVHVELHLTGMEGFAYLGRAYEAYCREQYPQAFVWAVRSQEAYREGLHALARSEEGKWEGFYRADWLTNVSSTVRNLETLSGWLRMHGDSPHFFQWYKEYLMPETEKYIYLENTHRNPLSNEELAERLGAHFGL